MEWDWYSQLPEELEAAMKERGEKAFRGRQIFTWLHRKHAASFAEMTDLRAELRERLQAEAPLQPLRIVQKQTSKTGEARTGKYLMELADGKRLIGIISHVQELEERIDKQIVVTKTPNGSTVRMNV